MVTVTSWAQADVPGVPVPTPSTSVDPAVPAAAVEAVPTDKLREAERAEFSGLRLVGDLLIGAAVGGAAGYGTYRGICGKEVCVGGFVAGAVVNLTATSAGVYGAGRLFGGRGTFKAAFWGTLIPFTATAALSSQYPMLAFGLGMALAPVTAAITYEISSNAEAQRLRHAATHSSAIVPFVAPISSRRSALAGGLVGLAALF
jgi:hypothetical protein